MESEQHNIEAPTTQGELTTKNEGKKTNILAIILGILVLALAGTTAFFGIKYFTNQGGGEGSESGEESANTKTESEITASNMATEYKEITSLLESLLSNISSSRNWVTNGSDLAYKVDGTNTFVPIKYSIRKETAGYISSADDDMPTLKTNLANAGFEYYGIIPFQGSAGPTIDGYLNNDTNTICGVIVDDNYYDNAAHPYIVLECAKTGWTWLTDEDKETIKEYATAYYNKIGSYPTMITDWSNPINNSEFEPYQYTYVYLSGAAGMFYRTNPNADWQYFTATQGVLECSEYNTDNLKKAYLGTSCWENGDSTVQL